MPSGRPETHAAGPPGPVHRAQPLHTSSGPTRLSSRRTTGGERERAPPSDQQAVLVAALPERVRAPGQAALSMLPHVSFCALQPAVLSSPPLPPHSASHGDCAAVPILSGCALWL